MPNLLFTDEEHAHAAELTRQFATNYHASLADRPVFPNIDRAALQNIMAAPLPQTPQSIDALFEELNAVIVQNSTHTAHSRFLPYVQPTPNALSPYAENVAAVINQNCNLWHLSPAANAVEQTVLRWFSDLFGLPQTSGGIITSGGSMANLIGLTAARDHHLGDAAKTKGLQGQSAPLVVYASEETHSSVDKAICTLGIGSDYLRHIPTDAHFRIRLDLLEEAIAQDRRDGLQPFCVVGNAGTVTTGAIDPIGDLATMCRKENLWLHIDGAYGALSALSARFKDTMADISLADSVSLDPHKFLFCSFEAGCVLVRDRQTLRHAFSASPSYLTMSEDPDFLDFANHGPQLSRGFKALKVWWSLKHFGVLTYSDTINRMADLATYMGEKIQQSPALELLAPVVFNCVCFRLSNATEEQNRAALKTLVDSGDAFLGPANVKGEIGLRACFMNLRTREQDIDFIISKIVERS